MSQMHIDGMIHVNINCSDYDRSLRFYQMLGFEPFWDVPPTNSAEVNAAVAMSDYQVKGALLALQNSKARVVIDLLEWQQPRSAAAPYETLYQPGLARLALSTSDLAADYEFLCNQGVEVVSPPATVMAGDGHGSRFFCFKDPDGTFLELVESF